MSIGTKYVTFRCDVKDEYGRCPVEHVVKSWNEAKGDGWSGTMGYSICPGHTTRVGRSE